MDSDGKTFERDPGVFAFSLVAKPATVFTVVAAHPPPDAADTEIEAMGKVRMT